MEASFWEILKNIQTPFYVLKKITIHICVQKCIITSRYYIFLLMYKADINHPICSYI